MDRTVTLQVPERLLNAIEQIARALPDNSTTVTVAVIAGFCTIIAGGLGLAGIVLGAYIQRRASENASNHTRLVERAASAANHLNQAWKELLALEAWTATELDIVLNTKEPREPRSYFLRPPQVEVIRMHLVFGGAKDLLAPFSEFDGTIRQLEEPFLALAVNRQNEKAQREAIRARTAVAIAADKLKNAMTARIDEQLSSLLAPDPRTPQV